MKKSMEELGDAFVREGGNFDEFCDKKGVVAVEAKAKLSELVSTNSTADILLNEIVKPNRFGQGRHPTTGKLYYGVPVATRDGKVIPAVYYDGSLIFGEENLKASGFNFTGDYALVGNTWNRTLLHAYLKKKIVAQSTRELLQTLEALSRRFVWHADERAHSIVAAFIMFSYLFSAFGKAPRMVFIGFANSGKSTATDFIAAYACNTLSTGDATKAYLFRSVDASAGMVVVDNIESLPEDVKRDLTQIFDISYEEHRAVGRVEDGGKGKVPKEFQTFCPMAINSVDYSWIKTSSRTRAIFILMTTNSGVKLDKLRAESAASIEALKHELRLWALENYERLAGSDVPVKFENRDQDAAKPLLAIMKDAGSDYLASGSEFLLKNFGEHHVADEFSDEAQLVGTIWNMIWERYTTKHELEVPLIVGEIAEASLAEKGFDQTMPRDKWAILKQKEATRIGNCIQNMPRVKSTNYSNRKRYHFNVVAFAKFMKIRGYELPDEAVKLLQTTLTNPNEPSHPPPTLTNPNIPSQETEEKKKEEEKLLVSVRVCEGIGGHGGIQDITLLGGFAPAKQDGEASSDASLSILSIQNKEVANA